MRAQESTVASRLNDVFPTANLTGEIKVKTDPSQLQVIRGPQHDLLTTRLMNEIIQMFDPKVSANNIWKHDRMDHERRVKLNFERLQTNWMHLRNLDVEMIRLINNPV